jgi:hypothetical protein
MHGQAVMIHQQEGKPKQPWANRHDPSAGKWAEAILNQMLEFHKAGDSDVKPVTISFNSVINTSWASSHDPSAGRQVEAILGQQLWPVSGKASQNNPWLNVGVSQSVWPGCQLPQIQSLSTLYLIHGWTVMIYQQEGKPKQSCANSHDLTWMSITPDTMTFYSVTNAWENSHNPPSGRQAKALLGQQSWSISRKASQSNPW